MILDRNNLHRDWGPSALNVKYQATYLRPLRTAVPQWRWLGAPRFGGWQADGIATLLSGFPFTPASRFQSFGRWRYAQS